LAWPARILPGNANLAMARPNMPPNEQYMGYYWGIVEAK
jgi:hypothetical protein